MFMIIICHVLKILCKGGQSVALKKRLTTKIVVFTSHNGDSHNGNGCQYMNCLT